MDFFFAIIQEQMGWDPSAPGARILMVLWALSALCGTWMSLRRLKGWRATFAVGLSWMLPLLGPVLVVAILRRREKQT